MKDDELLVIFMPLIMGKDSDNIYSDRGRYILFRVNGLLCNTNKIICSECRASVYQTSLRWRRAWVSSASDIPPRARGVWVVGVCVCLGVMWAARNVTDTA